MYKLFLFVIYLMQLLLQTECLYVGESCVAENEYGSCMRLKQCKKIVDEIKRSGNPMPAHVRKKLQSLTCGFDGSEPMVCCVSLDNSGHDEVTQRITIPDDSGKPTKGGSTIGDNGNSVGSGENTNDNVEPFTRATVESKNGPPDIQSHPNLKLLPTETCGIIESDRIFGGNRTRLFEMPWMVLLSYASARGPKLSCGGTIINNRYILTAAHCISFLSDNLKLDGVILGEYDIRDDPDCEVTEGARYCAPSIINSTIESSIAHPRYSAETLNDDIGLIRLSEPANFKLDSIKPICLPTTPKLLNEALPGLNGVVAGWGVTEDGLQSPVLLSVDLPIISPKDCMAAYNGTLELTKGHICAGGVKDKDSCGGDSGGPLMYPGLLNKLGVRYVQRGIVSFGPKRCGVTGFPGVYTNVAYYMDWILDNIHS